MVVWSEMQTCIWPSWCHCYSPSLASVKSRLFLPFWYRLTRVVPEKGPLNGCVCVCWIHYAFLQLSMLVWWWTCDFSNQLIITQMLMYGWCHWTDRSSLRKSTCEKTRSTEDCVREREARTAVMRQIADRKHVADVRRLTQEELLAEAKITEKINLRSLGLWRYS